MPASCAYGRPSCVKPPRVRVTGRADASTCGKKPSRIVCVSSARVSSVRIEPPISFSQQRFLGCPARIGERTQLPRVGLGALGSQLARDHVSQRQVHVVAAQQDVFADRDTMQLKIAFAFDHRDQRQVGRAAAHVHNQDDVADLHLLAPGAAAFLDPAIERGLRFLQQRHAGVASRLRCLGRQFSCGRIEGSRNGDRDFLLAERCIGMRVVPCFTQMREIANRAFKRRDARHFRRRVAWQDRRATVHTRMTEPALGARHETNWRPCASAACHFTDCEIAFGSPWQGQVTGRQFARMGQVEKRGQQLGRFDRPRCGELRDLQDALHGFLAVTGEKVNIRQSAVGGAQIDAD
jgi:hypothetical protein